MAKTNISITDENAILITVQFIDSGKKIKAEKTTVESYDIELIVKNNILCEQLMDAIRFGLKKKLKDVYNIDVDTLNSDYFRKDSRHPETETINVGDVVQALSDKDIYILCWLIYNDCIRSYENNMEVSAVEENNIQTHCVGIGSINKRVFQEENKDSIAHEDQIWLKKHLHGKKTLEELGFITTTRLVFDTSGWHRSAALFQDNEVNKGFREDIPLYNISDRPLLSLDDTPVKIIPPTELPKKNKQNLLISLLSPLLMMGAMIVARLFSGMGISNGSMIFMTIAMGSVTIFVTLLNITYQHKEYEGTVREWREHYETYIQRVIDDIQKKQNWDIRQLKRLYPSKFGGKDSIGLVKMTKIVHSDIFSRGCNHPDYLSVRLGISTEESHLVPSVFKIIGERKEVVFTSVRYKNIENRDKAPFSILLPNENEKKSVAGYLIDLPFAISQKYGYLKKAPVLLNLKECGTLGVVFPDRMSFQPFLDNILLELCFYHSPDDLQCILFCEETAGWKEREKMIDKYKHLPHFRELLGDLSAFAFNKNDANLILNKLLELINERKNEEDNSKFPHILVIFQEEYEFKRHPISEYLPDMSDDSGGKAYGMSFIFCKRFSEKLPKYCGRVIHAKNKKEWFLLPHEQRILRTLDSKTVVTENYSQYSFIPDPPPPEQEDLDRQDEVNDFYRAYKILSALYYHRIAQGANVPSRIEFFDLYKKLKEADNELSIQVEKLLSEEWGIKAEGNNSKKKKKDVTKSLIVPIGKKYEDTSDVEESKGNGVVWLDLHEKADGPHMLVAGTTGSGKSETILTYLIGLCTIYTPLQVNLLLVDMKGGGFIKRIGHLPHIVGTITDVDGDENGAGASHMLKRFLHSMKAEIKRRKLLFNRLEVDSIDGYINARESLKNMESHIKNLHLDPSNSDDRHQIDRMKELLDPSYGLPHLFLVIDEFTELMRFSADNSDIDFKAEINTLARVGRSLGFHIILISQNIQGAITDEIRHNSKSFLCLRVATREASKEMIGTDLAASPLMPGNGRAYLLVGTGSRFEYFQSAYSGADVTRNIEQPVYITQAEVSGEYSDFYYSYDDNPNTNKEINKSKSGVSQSQFLVEQISLFANKHNIKAPHPVFQQPLPLRCFYEFDWSNGTGKYRILRSQNNEERKAGGIA